MSSPDWADEEAERLYKGLVHFHNMYADMNARDSIAGVLREARQKGRDDVYTQEKQENKYSAIVDGPLGPELGQNLRSFVEDEYHANR